MNIGKETNQEFLIITPEKELEYAMDGIKQKKWGEVAECLSQLVCKISDAGLSAEDREKLREKFEEIKTACQNADIPEEVKDNKIDPEKITNYRSLIEGFLRQADDAL